MACCTVPEEEWNAIEAVYASLDGRSPAAQGPAASRRARPAAESRRWVVNIRSGEPFDVYVGRTCAYKDGSGTLRRVQDLGWGNPFRIGGGMTRSQAVSEYEKTLRGNPDMIERAKRELRGKVLACWCHPADCHAHVLARYANE